MPLPTCTAEAAVLYFRDSEHLLQGLAQPQHQAEPVTKHLPLQIPPAWERELESSAMGDTKCELKLLRCDLMEET